jgi:hypothetical protein
MRIMWHPLTNLGNTEQISENTESLHQNRYRLSGVRELKTETRIT